MDHSVRNRHGLVRRLAVLLRMSGEHRPGQTARAAVTDKPLWQGREDLPLPHYYGGAGGNSLVFEGVGKDRVNVRSVAPHDRRRSATDEIGAAVRSKQATTDLDPPSGTRCPRTRARSDPTPIKKEPHEAHW